MSTPEYIDRTGASSGKFAVRLHTIESATDAPESWAASRKRAAREIQVTARAWGTPLGDGVALDLADAAIAAITTAQSGTDR